MAQVTSIENKRPSDAPQSPSPPAFAQPNPPTWAIKCVGIGAILAICYFAEETLAGILISVLIAFILAPLVDLLSRLRLPRWLSAAISVALLLAAIAGVTYYSFNQASKFVEELPKYTEKIRDDISKLTRKAQNLEALTPTQGKGVVTVHETHTVTDLLSRGFGSVSQAILAASFIPFLTFFMLTWQEHARNATVGLFPPENRRDVHRTIGLISAMVRSFMVGNLLIGLLMGAISTAVFGLHGIPFFYFAGFLSGFLSLIPYLGVVLALLPPLFVGLGHLGFIGIVWVVLTVFGLHVVSLNVLYPKLLGGRLHLNPLAVSIALLVWAWLWGAIGLVLAIPITAAMKIIFDHVESLKPFGAWLGEPANMNGNGNENGNKNGEQLPA